MLRQWHVLSIESQLYSDIDTSTYTDKQIKNMLCDNDIIKIEQIYNESNVSIMKRKERVDVQENTDNAVLGKKCNIYWHNRTIKKFHILLETRVFIFIEKLL